MTKPTLMCAACCICGAPESAAWHVGGAMAEMNYRYVPCRTALVRSKRGQEFEHDGPCRGVEHRAVPAGSAGS